MLGARAQAFAGGGVVCMAPTPGRACARWWVLCCFPDRSASLTRRLPRPGCWKMPSARATTATTRRHGSMWRVRGLRRAPASCRAEPRCASVAESWAADRHAGAVCGAASRWKGASKTAGCLSLMVLAAPRWMLRGCGRVSVHLRNVQISTAAGMQEYITECEEERAARGSAARAAAAAGARPRLRDTV